VKEKTNLVIASERFLRYEGSGRAAQSVAVTATQSNAPLARILDLEV